MQHRYAILAALVAGVNALPQAQPTVDAAPPGCTASYNGLFHIAVVNVSSLPTSSGTPATQIGDGQLNVQTDTGVCQIGDGQLQAHSGSLVNQTGDGQLTVPQADPVNQIGDGQLQSTSGSNPCESTLNFTLADGVVKDGNGRTLEIVANHQLQADNPTQPDALHTYGFSICTNGSLALGLSAVFYQCQSGDFFNLYDTPAGAACNAILISTFNDTQTTQTS